jgi:hypothetical protein
MRNTKRERNGRIKTAVVVLIGASCLFLIAVLMRDTAPTPTIVPEPAQHRANVRGTASQGARPASAVRTNVLDTVAALSTDVWVLRFMGLQPVRVLIRTPDGKPLSCRVLTAGGEVVTSQRAMAGSCALSWTPVHTGAFHIEVHNPREHALPYALSTQQ